MFEVVGISKQDFVQLALLPDQVPEVKDTIARIKASKATAPATISFLPRHFLVRSTDIDESRKQIAAMHLQPIIEDARKVIKEFDEKVQKAAKDLQQELTVSLAKAKALAENLTEEELAQLRALLAKTDGAKKASAKVLTGKK